METEEKPVQAYTLKQLAVLYKTPIRTFRKWIRRHDAEIGPRIGHFYNPRQVRIIFDLMGRPVVFFFTLLFKILSGGVSDHQHSDGGGK